MKHTPTPWRLGKWGASIVSDSKENLTIDGSYDESSRNYYGGYLIGESITKANAERIIECVNACGRIENPQQLIEVASLVAASEKSLAIEINTLQEERDELLAALKNLANAYSATLELEYGDSIKMRCEELSQAKELITKYNK